MASGSQLKTICYSRLRTARILIKAQDWEMAAYMMGYVLETLLKAAACHALHLATYPDDPDTYQRKEIRSFFMTHDFDRLLCVSGLSDIFTTNNVNWSSFRFSYTNDWPNMRYDVTATEKFTEETVKNLYRYLYEDANSIVKVTQRARRW